MRGYKLEFSFDAEPDNLNKDDIINDMPEMEKYLRACGATEIRWKFIQKIPTESFCTREDILAEKGGDAQ